MDTKPHSQKTFTSVFIVFAFLAVCVSCKKYEDGPAISLRTKKMRVTGDWLAHSVVREDGNVYNINYDLFRVLIEKDGRFMRGGNPSRIGTWEFEKKATLLVLHFEPGTSKTTWRIRKLTEEDLWVKQDGSEELIKFRKIKP